MDPWDHIRRAVADDRSGSLAVAARAAVGLAGLTTARDRRKAGRALVRAHPSMGLVRRLAAASIAGDDPLAFAERARAETTAAADGVRWVVTKRSATVLTHSASDSVARALDRIRGRVAHVYCTVSLPGGEGRVFARALEREGFDTTVIADAAIADACEEADVALVGSDAITPDGVVNKMGTTLVALAARAAGIGCYAIACGSKMVAEAEWDERFELTPLALFDAVLTERGPMRANAVRRAIARLERP